MTTRRNPWVLRAGALALALLPSSTGQAQPAAAAATTRSQVTVVRVKPDMLNEWIDLQKNEVMPAQKKGGVTTRTVLQTAVGNSFEYLIITPFPDFASMDGQNPQQKALGTEAAARLGTKIRKCIDVQRTYMLNRRDDLLVAQGTAGVLRTTVRQAAAGKQQEYLNYLKTDVVPVMKKAKDTGKIAGYNVSIRGVGAQAGEITTTTYYNKFAEMDAGNPLVVVLGAAAAAPIIAKGDALSTPVQTIIRRRVADLSF